MKYQILAAGKPALAYARTGIAEYLKRLTRSASVDLIYRKAGDSESVSRDFLAQSEGSMRIAMDERGELLDTAAFVQKIDRWEMAGEIKTISFLIGASDGHSAALREKSDFIWALSPLTMQHELALVVLLEQLYRAHTIKRGEPYHR